jgi:ABC-2 type transport system ATP-binding protein
MSLYPDPIIQLTDLSKTYRDAGQPAISGLCLAVEKGEIFGLLGPNGAGKTTTISIMAGLIRPDNGEVTIAGHNLKTSPKQIRQVLGVVPQDIALYPSLTAEENLSYFGRLYGLDKKTLQERIATGLARLGLDKHAYKRVFTYSGGMKRRLNLLAGIIHKPAILILDEPTVGIDVHSRKVILDLLHEINAQGTTLFYTSHYLEEAQRLCTRIAIIDYGKIIVQGSPSEIIAATQQASSLEDVFLRLTGHEVRD